jgi:hypothetical protein
VTGKQSCNYKDIRSFQLVLFAKYNFNDNAEENMDRACSRTRGKEGPYRMFVGAVEGYCEDGNENPSGLHNVLGTQSGCTSRGPIEHHSSLYVICYETLLPLNIGVLQFSARSRGSTLLSAL